MVMLERVPKRDFGGSVSGNEQYISKSRSRKMRPLLTFTPGSTLGEVGILLKKVGYGNLSPL